MKPCASCGYKGTEVDASVCGLCSAPLAPRAAATAVPAALPWRSLTPEAYVPAGASASWLLLLLWCLLATLVPVQIFSFTLISGNGGAPPVLRPGLALLVGLTSLAFLGLLVVVVPVWLTWAYRVTANARALAHGVWFTPGQAVLVHLIPVVNLVAPWLLLVQVFRASDPRADPHRWPEARGGAGVVHAYWWLGLSATLPSILGAAGRASHPALELAGAGGAVASVLLSIVMIKEVTRRQDERYQRALFELHHVDAPPAAAVPKPPKTSATAISAPSPTGGASTSPSGRVVRAAVSRCPFCHDDVAPQDSVVCQECQARHHGGCWAEAGRCSACGGERRMEVAEGVSGTRIRRPSARIKQPPGRETAPRSLEVAPADGAVYCPTCSRHRPVAAAGRCVACGTAIAIPQGQSASATPALRTLARLIPGAAVLVGFGLMSVGLREPIAFSTGMFVAFAGVVIAVHRATR